MNNRIRVVDTAPLIFLAKLHRLELLQLGADVVYAPPSVLSELRAVPDEATEASEIIALQIAGFRVSQALIERVLAEAGE